MVGPAVKREGVAHLRATMGLSERRACSIVSADRKMVRYRSSRPPDTELRTQLRDLANERKRFGYRRLFVLLRQKGEPSGINRIYRLYREEGLTVRKRRARRRAVGSRVPILVESKPNARWSVDFVHDSGRRFAQGLVCGMSWRAKSQLSVVEGVRSDATFPFLVFADVFRFSNFIFSRMRYEPSRKSRTASSPASLGDFRLKASMIMR